MNFTVFFTREHAEDLDFARKNFPHKVMHGEKELLNDQLESELNEHPKLKGKFVIQSIGEELDNGKYLVTVEFKDFPDWYTLQTILNATQETYGLEGQFVKQLHAGDQVFWNDPDGGKCSRLIVISSITIDNEVVSITGTDGSQLDCFIWELQ